MARPRSTSVSISHDPGRAKPFRCRWRNAAGQRRSSEPFLTLEEALDFKKRTEQERSSIVPRKGRPPLARKGTPKSTATTAPVVAGLGLMATAPKGSLTVTQVAAEWTVRFLPKKKPATRASYTTQLDTHILPLIGDVLVKPGVLGTRVVLGLLENRAQLGLKASSQQQILLVLSSLLQWAVYYQHLDTNPCRGLWGTFRNENEIELDSKEPNPLTRDQADAFLLWLQNSKWRAWFPYFLLLLRTGMRRGEGAALRWTDLFLDRPTPGPQALLKKTDSAAQRRFEPTSNGEVSLKNKKSRTIDLSPALVTALRGLKPARRLASPYVFLRPEGGRVTAADPKATRIFDKGMEAVGVEGRTIHDLRDTFATCHLLADPARLLWVSAMLGHSNPQMTMRRYVRYLPTNAVGQLYVGAFDESSAKAGER